MLLPNSRDILTINFISLPPPIPHLKMLHPNPNLHCYLLMSSFACLAQSTSIPNVQVQERAIIPFRGGAPEIPPPRPIMPETPGSLGGVRPGSVIGGGSLEAGSLSGLAAAGRGTAPESTTPFLPNTNGGNRELAEKAMEAAGMVFDLLQNVVDVVGGGGDDDDDDDADSNNDDDDLAKWRASTTTTNPSQAIKPTQAASSSNTTTAANYILSQNNETYTFPSDPRLMSYNVVASMSNSSYPRLKSEQDLFTPSEYRMYLNDPICFYANIESMYLDAFSSSSPSGISSGSSTGIGTSTESATTPTPTQILQRRQGRISDALNNAQNGMCSDIDGSPSACSSLPEWTSSQLASVSSLWARELPDQLWSAHFATPATASGDDVTATATSTTSCSGLNGGEGPVTKYRELKMRETSGGSESGTATLAANDVEGGATRIGEGWNAYVLFGAAVAAVGVSIL